MKENKASLLIYKSQDNKTKIQTKMVEGSIWLTQSDMVQLFDSSKANISEHIKNILEEGELQANSVVRNFRTTASDNKTYEILHYNLEMIIAVGLRVRSSIGTHFRQWANEILQEYLVKGFSMNDELLYSLASLYKGFG